MACGTPVVTRAIGGAPDLVTDDVAGRVVDSETPSDIAEAVKDLLNNLPERKAVRDFAQNFDWHATSDGQMQIFEKAIRDYNGTER